MTDPIIVALIAGLLGGGLFSGLAALMRARSGKTVDFIASAKNLVEEYRKQVDELRLEVARLQERVRILERVGDFADSVLAGAHRLYNQITELGECPVYHPPERRIGEPDLSKLGEFLE